MDLSIIIVNYNAKEVLSQCLNSIYVNNEDVNFEIIVMDNSSSDGSSQAVKQAFPQVKLIQNKNNQGLTRAQNQGLRLAQGRYILLLNNDTLLQPQTLAKLINFLDKTPDSAIAGPKIYTETEPQVSFACLPKNRHLFILYILFKKIFSKHKFKKIHYDYSHNLEVDYVSGACLIIRKSVMENIGYMDEGYFVYNEDDDLCLRVRQKGYKIYYLPEAKVIHLRGKGGGGLHPYRMILEIHKGIFRLYRKFYPKPNFLLDALMAGILILRLAVKIVIRFFKSINGLSFYSKMNAKKILNGRRT